MKSLQSIPSFLSLLPVKAASLTLAFAAGILAASTSYAAPLFEEQFSNSTEFNQNLASIGWKGYGGSGAVDLTDSNPAERGGTLFVSIAPGNPAMPIGFLAAALLNENGMKEYAAIKTDLNLQNPGTFSWRMTANPGTSIQVRLLVKVGEKWYASRKGSSPATLGTLGEFPGFSVPQVESVFSFNTKASTWANFSLNPGASLAVGENLKADLPSSTVSGLGFYITTADNIGGILRIDTVQVIP